MIVRDCIINNIPIWRLKFDELINNRSDDIKDEVWYMVHNKIYKSSIKNFRINLGNLVWFKNVANNLMYNESMEEEVDEKETIKCLFKFYSIIA